MAEPLLPWESNSRNHPQLVWREKLDNRYLVEVRRTGSNTGVLYVFDHDRGDPEIASWEVSLSYRAQFGPDVADIEDWQEKVIDFIDNHYSNR